METQNIERDENSIDIRDIGSYLLGKLWLILLVTVCFAVVALLFTTLLITPTYTSTSEMFIINAGYSSSSTSTTTTDWTIGKQLAKTAPSLVTIDFCQKVAVELNQNEDFVKKYGEISAKQIKNCISVSSDGETCIITIKAVTTNGGLSADVVNAIAKNFESYIKDTVKTDSVRTSITLEGKVPSSASNIHPLRNTVIFGAVGAVLICAVLIVIFIFDDKIKTPDDIEKYLKLNVLGTIPDIEKEN